tara:strand:+ start:86 stop:397 length:312 start_codon:yes stop_codon:yes gene_type:complete
MDINDRVEKAVFKAIDEWNNDEDQTIVLNKKYDTKLLSQNSSLDSLGIIHILVSIEEQIETEFDVHVSLATEEAMAEDENPFNNIGSIINYAKTLLLKEISNE